MPRLYLEPLEARFALAADLALAADPSGTDPLPALEGVVEAEGDLVGPVVRSAALPPSAGRSSPANPALADAVFFASPGSVASLAPAISLLLGTPRDPADPVAPVPARRVEPGSPGQPVQWQAESIGAKKSAPQVPPLFGHHASVPEAFEAAGDSEAEEEVEEPEDTPEPAAE